MAVKKWYNTSQFKQAGWKSPISKSAYEAGKKTIKTTPKQMLKGLKAAAKKGNIAKGSYIPMAKAGMATVAKRATLVGGAAYGAYEIAKNTPKIIKGVKGLVRERKQLRQSRQNLSRLQSSLKKT